MNSEFFRKKTKLKKMPPISSIENYDEIQYLRILDTYGINWSIENCATGTLQNFFDAKNGTMDQIDISISLENQDYIIKIKDEKEYSLERLLHLGGTTKGNCKFSAGGHGEGTKILALTLLRDYDFSQVRFGSQNWMLDFFLEFLPKGEYPDQRKGLFAGITKIKKPINGNFIEFKTKSQNYAQTFIDAKKLFYSKDNPDFQKPSIDIKNVGGFKYLPRKKNSIMIPKGNFYYMGQRKYFEKKEWNTVEHVHLWTYQQSDLNDGRDDNIISRAKLSSMIPKILNYIPKKDLVRLVYEMEPLWTNTWNFEIGYRILEGIAKILKKNKTKLEFENQYLSTNLFTPRTITENLKNEGYILCANFFSDLGMKNVQEKFLEMQQHYKIPLSSKEKEKINLLYDATKPLQKKLKEIWLFDKTNEKNILQGQGCSNFIWLAKETLQKPFNEAFATYLHEVDHEYGSDLSIEFSYALTRTMEKVINAISKQPAKYQRIKKRWDNLL